MGKTNKAEKPAWQSTGGPSSNQILEGDGFFISYMPPAALNMWGMFASDNSSDETALVIRQSGGRAKYLILNGDFRADYERLLPQGLEACRAFYEKNAASNASSWSNA